MSGMPSTADRRLARLTRRQHGVFSVRQAERCGLPQRTVSARSRAGRYSRVQPGVYRVAAAPDGRRARYMAAVLAVTADDDPAVLSHGSAADVWGVDPGRGDVIHVVSETHHPGRLDGVRAHRTKALPERHRAEHGGIPVTSPERTLCELACCVGYERLRRAVASAVRRDLVTAASVAATMSELGRIRGKRKLRMILTELNPLEREAREGLESLFLRTLSWAGFPPSAMNHPTRDADGARRLLDAVYLRGDYDLVEPVWVELDGREFHTSPLDVLDDREREDLLVAAGWPRPLRYTWTDLVERPDRVIREIRAALQVRRVVRDGSILR